MSPLLSLTDRGVHCSKGEFYIDPWRPTGVCVITHAHSDHARAGGAEYHTLDRGVSILKSRIPSASRIIGHPSREKFKLGSVWVSFHPAGHILGSAQVRVEDESDVWVFTGDFKRAPDPSCDAFEPVECDGLITEATFALPIYRWRPTSELIDELLRWWEENRREQVTSLLLGYPLGKSQRLLAELHGKTDRPVHLHGGIAGNAELYRRAGVVLAPTVTVNQETPAEELATALVIAPPSAFRSTWMRRFKSVSTAFASGWMTVRGARRWRGYDRGFALSDHADWGELLRTVAESKASRILTTHGYSGPLARALTERGLSAAPLQTPFGEEETE